MTLQTVHMSPEVYYACTLHANTVEKEEVMGLLIGQFDKNQAQIRAMMPMQRADKRKDRVEISTEQLFGAVDRVKKISEQLGAEVNVVGWYHSHPHITVEPSHVDLRTQYNYQVMDNRFFGLIFSVFNEDKNMGQEMQVTCFQSIPGQSAPYNKQNVSLYIEHTRLMQPPCLDAVIELPSILVEEEKDFYNSCRGAHDILSQAHNDSKFVSSMCHIMKTTMNPLLFHMEHRVSVAEEKCRQLERERNELMQMRREQKSISRKAAKLSSTAGQMN